MINGTLTRHQERSALRAPESASMTDSPVIAMLPGDPEPRLSA